jgi:hypothetical protein
MATNSRRYWVPGNRPLRETSYSWGTGLRDGVRLGILVRIGTGQRVIEREGKPFFLSNNFIIKKNGNTARQVILNMMSVYRADGGFSVSLLFFTFFHGDTVPYVGHG